MMAKEYTVNRFGKKVNYRKVGSKYFRIKADGTLAKDAATGLILANLKNAAGSSIVTTPKKVADRMLASVKSSVNGTNKKGQMGRGIKKAMASNNIPDGGRAALQKSKDKDKKALDIIKKDTNIKTDAKPLVKKKIEKKKEVIPLKKIQSKVIKTTKTKALQNKPKEDVKKKVEKKITKKPESKLDSKGNYKGTNIKPTKLQLGRLKKRGLA